MKYPQVGLCLALVVGCGPSEEGDLVVARVGDEILTEVELRSQFPYDSSLQEGGEGLRIASRQGHGPLLREVRCA